MSKVAETRFTLDYPELGTGPVPTDSYWKDAFYEREKAAIFQRAWLWVGRVEQLPNPGDFFLREIPTFEASILIVRGKDQKIRAFQNVCQHRGNHLALTDQGNCRVFTCPFHGWSYDLNGELAGVPDSGAFYDLDRSLLGLPKLSVDTWEGFIFVHFDSAPTESLEAFMGEQGDGLRGYPFEKGEAIFSYEGRIRTNWKCMVDSFTEAYHVPVLHKRSVRDSICGPHNPHGRLLDIALKGHHRKVSVAGNPGYEPRPVQGLAYRFSPGAAVTSGDGSGLSELPPGLNPTRDPSWAFDVAVFFPNWLLLVGSGMYFLHQIWPLSANEVQWEMRGFLRPADNAAERFGQENSIVELRDAVLEDTNTLERIQSSMRQGAIRQFVFHDHELALRYHHHTVMRWVEAYEAATF
jgi:Rieske 2Fe-2S family protein